MNKNENRVKWLLGIGAILIYMAGISFFLSDIGNSALKIIVNTLISVGLLAVSISVEENFKLKGLGKFSFSLGFLSFISTFIYIGSQELFGSYFSLYGDGYRLYGTFIFILISLFAHVVSLRYKDYVSVHIKYSALLLALYTFMSHFSSNMLANLSVIGVILLFLNCVKINDNINNFGRITSLVYVIITFIITNGLTLEDNQLVFAWLITIVNAINLFMVMYKDKRVPINVVSIILYALNIRVIVSSLSNGFNIGVYLMIAASLLSLFEILLNYLNVIKDKQISIALKIFINLAYFELFSLSGNVFDYFILAIILIATSLINSFVYKNDEYEYTIMPLKISFIVTALFKLVDAYIISMSEAICWILLDLTYLIIMYFSKNDKHKLECIVLTLFYSYLLLSYDIMTPALYVMSGLIALLNYYVIIIKSDERNTARGRLYYGFLLFMLLISLENFDFNNSKYLIASLVFGLLTISTYNDHIGFAITLPALLTSLLWYISGNTALTVESKSFLNVVLYYACFTMWINNLTIKSESKNVLQSISLIFISLMSLSSGGVLNTLVTIVVAVIMIYLGIKNAEYKALHGSGIFIVIISLLSLTSFLGEARAFIYLLVVGGAIIYSVIRLASKGIPENNDNVILEEQKENIQKEEPVLPADKEQKIMFCYNCGNSLNGDEKFCGKCGAKLK